jgi:hypothetical protein
MLYIPTYNGGPIFGYACEVRHNPHPTALQVDAFFGVAGSIMLFGGGRGRLFEIKGTLQDVDVPALMGDIQVINNYVNGIAGTFTDSYGRSWQNVVIPAQVREGRILETDIGWCLEFSVGLLALT